MNFRIIIFSIICIFIYQLGFSQDPHFSQIQYNPIYLNPAFAGFAKKDNRVVGVYRDQWRTAFVPYSTTFGSYDRKFKQWEKGWRLGGGISFLYDRAGEGILSTFNPNLTLAVGKYFNNEKQLLNFGITSGITIKSLNYSKLTFDNQYVAGSGYVPGSTPGESFSNNNVSYPNFTIGLNFTTKLGEKSSLDIGGAASNVHQPNQNFLYFSESKLPARYTAYAKALVGLGKSDKWNLQPAFIYNFQNKANNILVNAIAETKFKENNKGKTLGLGFGAGFRVQDVDAAIAYISVLYDDLRIGASYDINLSKYKGATNTMGAFELLLSYEWGNSKKKKCTPDTIRIKEFEILRDTVYLTDTIIQKDTVIQIKETTVTPEQIQKWNESLSKFLPAIAYFDNDYPDPKSQLTTTNANYKDLYENYISKRAKFVDYIGEEETSKLFDTIGTEFNKLIQIYGALKEILDRGKEVKLQFAGYTSPLSTVGYNQKLSSRRIESVMNYLFSLENGYLKKYLDNQQLTFEEVPLGKSKAPESISDKADDYRNSVYGRNASMQRKVEIKAIYIK